jgi:citrate/tricarballylate utilization protein
MKQPSGVFDLHSDESLRKGAQTMAVCNACRYCEEFCPVFPAMERRLSFAKGDLTYLANLCHNCGECLYSCQYAPPHEFGINVPRTLAEIRVYSYEEYCWPRFLGAAFRHHGLLTSVGLAGLLSGILFAFTLWSGINPIQSPSEAGDFYSVISHRAMVTLFGTVSLFVMVALTVAIIRFWRDVEPASSNSLRPSAVVHALRDMLTLRHLHADGANCTSAEEVRGPWRRWFHHCTFYGFMLCFASTSVAAFYHSVLGWSAPYGYTSLPVLLGVIGGIGLLIGPTGLFLLRQRRDPELRDSAQSGLDVSFIALLFLTSISGLLLLVLREHAAMGPLLIAHLGIVLALFVTLPYGKFVHGIYRAAALLKSAFEEARESAADVPKREPAIAAPPLVPKPASVSTVSKRVASTAKAD